MNIEEFDKTYAVYKSVDQIEITCDCEQCANPKVKIGKQPARRNILKNGGKQFICRQCFMKYNNPMNRVGESRQTNEEIVVVCPHPEHKGSIERQMKKSCYYGEMSEPYIQVCKSCAQLGKIISEEQRQAISEALSDRELTQEHKNAISSYMKAHPERWENLKQYYNPRNTGKKFDDEWKNKIGDANRGKIRTEEQCKRISTGRKKMLSETGGFSDVHRKKLSHATVEQYQRGFDPNSCYSTGWHSSPKAENGKAFYRSSYERKAYMILDGDNTVRSYKTECIPISYVNPIKGCESTYIVDLDIVFTDGSRKIVEVKPEKFLTDPVVSAKIDAAKKYANGIGVIFEVWSEPFLFTSEQDMRSFAEWLKAERS